MYCRAREREREPRQVQSGVRSSSAFLGLGLIRLPSHTFRFLRLHLLLFILCTLVYVTQLGVREQVLAIIREETV